MGIVWRGTRPSVVERPRTSDFQAPRTGHFAHQPRIVASMAMFADARDGGLLKRETLSTWVRPVQQQSGMLHGNRLISCSPT